jgi:hypothetical protein
MYIYMYTVHDVRVCKYVHAHVDLYEMPLGINGEVLGYLNNYEQIGWCFLAGSQKKTRTLSIIPSSKQTVCY